MIARYNYNGVTWVDLESPNNEEIAHVLEEFSLPAVAGQEMLTNTLRARVDTYDAFIYVILHFPIDAAGNGEKTSEQEVDFLLGSNFVITVRYNLIDPLHQFASVFEKRLFGPDGKKTYPSGYIFMEMMRHFYHRSLHELELMGEKIKHIEQRIFEGKEAQMVKEISRMSRRLLDFKRSLRFHGDVLHSYESASVHLFGGAYVHYADLITSDYNKVHTLLESHRDTLAELQRTNDSLLSTKTNDTMRTFTILTFVMVPLTVITGIFGMNTTENLVFIRERADFFLVIVLMFFIAFLMFLFFKLRKWL